MLVTFETLEHRGRVGACKHRVAERRRQLLEDRGVQQELAASLRQRVQHALAQVRDERPIVAGELHGNRLGITLGPERDPDEVQRDRPAFGAPHQILEHPAVERDAHRLQRLPPLRRREQERRRAEGPQPALGLDAPDRKRGRAAAREHELRTGRHRIDHGLNHRPCFPAAQRVEIVEHQSEGLPTTGDESFDGGKYHAGEVGVG